MNEKKVAELTRKITQQLATLNEAELNMQTKIVLLECQTLCRNILDEITGDQPQAVPDAEKIIKLFVVDDDEDTQRILRYTLKKRGFTVTSETNPITAIDRINEVKPDIIMLDIMMPNMTGFEFLAAVAEHPLRSTFKIAMGSSRNYDQDRLASLKAGANDFFSKPYNLSELTIKLRNLSSR